MPPNHRPPLTPEQYLQRKAIRVVPASLAGPYGICLQPYTAPVVLACGHMFDRECVKSWLDEPANTCPTCRAELYVGPPTRSTRDGGAGAEDATSVLGSFALSPRPADAGPLIRVARPVEEVLVNHHLVARSSVLTPYGARLVLNGLWRYTAVSLQRHEVFGQHAIAPDEAGDMDVEMLRGMIQQAIPRDVSLERDVGQSCMMLRD
ncbi:hypothetical protein E8E12_006624 [Didymella heteroderae]|uniref:RING-type domain-containing protein n=1 Tax=Didymella heteroderae TaxID=1769908 RepID=A0A9P4WKR0_9PLEO|nr:hypothetical protein E8E12_006624 [Didymella heteroderae]